MSESGQQYCTWFGKSNWDTYKFSFGKWEKNSKTEQVISFFFLRNQLGKSQVYLLVNNLLKSCNQLVDVPVAERGHIDVLRQSKKSVDRWRLAAETGESGTRKVLLIVSLIEQGTLMMRIVDNRVIVFGSHLFCDFCFSRIYFVR